MGKWDPDSYLKFEDERTQPSHDLVSRIDLVRPASIIDIGCGPGNSTMVLRQRWPLSRIIGLDLSPEMIAKAKETYPRENWLMADAAGWECDERFDVVFSNATLQWIPNHEFLIRKLWNLMNISGALAVQVPANTDSPLYQAVSTVSRRNEWKEALSGCGELFTYHDPEFYYDLLSADAKRVYVWRTTYYHLMADHQGLIDWYASTGMRPYLERLADSQRHSFREQVLEKIRGRFPRRQDGKILFPFRRLFFIAYRE